VGVVKISTNFDRKFFKGIKDSKKLSETKREKWFKKISEVKPRRNLEFTVSLVSEKIIDKHGIAYAIRLGIKRCLDKLKVKATDQIFLDGGIKAPEKFIHQKTIIKGDEKMSVISLASVCAKVTRDRYMVRLSKKYPKYGFDVHKGYGTLMHRQNIKKYGPVGPYRRTFLKHLTKGR